MVNRIAKENLKRIFQDKPLTRPLRELQQDYNLKGKYYNAVFGEIKKETKPWRKYQGRYKQYQKERYRIMKLEPNIIFYALNYALTRTTYAPAIVAEYLVHNWNNLSKIDKKKIQEEIEYAIKKNKNIAERDIATWNRVLGLKV